MNLKSKLIEVCKNHLLQIIDELRLVVDEAQTSANEYGAPKDRYDSYRAQLLRKRDMFAQQLSINLERLDVFDKINPEKKCAKVEFGAIVKTSAQNIFVSTAIGKLQVEGITYYAISAFVPIFKAMEGKGIGEEFTFNGNRIQILDIL